MPENTIKVELSAMGGNFSYVLEHVHIPQHLKLDVVFTISFFVCLFIFYEMKTMKSNWNSI